MTAAPMFRPLAWVVALASAAPLVAQTQLVNPEGVRPSNETAAAAALRRLEYRQDPVAIGLVSIVNDLLRSTAPSKDVAAQVQALIAEAGQVVAQGNSGEAKRRLSHAVALLRGVPWTPTEEFGLSLVLHPFDAVADSGEPLFGELRQNYSAPSAAANAVRLRLSLARAPASTAVDVIGAAGAKVKQLGTVEVLARDLNDQPFRFQASLAGVIDGDYLLVGEVLDGEKSITRVVAPLSIIADLHAKRADIERRLAAISGHAAAVATIRFPFSLADGLKSGRREIISYDFAAGVARSSELLAALEQGRDLIHRAKGSVHRAYYFAEADDHVPYRVYVPASWDGQKKLPLVVALHGGNLDENNFLTRADGLMMKLAEQHGFIVVTPLGYRLNSGYGVLNPAGEPPPSPLNNMMATLGARRIALSEQDVLNVTRLVAEEYGADASRFYLMGNSMGGSGAWHIAIRHPELWAAIAPSASRAGVTPQDVDQIGQLRSLAVMTLVGELDPNLTPVRATVAQLRAHGIAVDFAEVKGATHGTAVEVMLPQIFEFFAQHRKSGGT